MLRILPLLLTLAVASGCAASDKAMVYTEGGISAGADAWDAVYKAKAADCESKFEPATPPMEECFLATFDANEAVGVAITSAVALLRVYWVARAAGETPDFAKLTSDLGLIFKDLPPEATKYFDRVKGMQ